MGRVDDGIAGERDGHVIVCGLGALGLRVVEVLRSSNVPVRLVDDSPDPRLLPIIQEWGVPLTLGNPRLQEVLLRAGLADARSVISVQGGDLANLETALVIRSLRPETRIIVQMANAAVGSAMGDLLSSGAALDVASLAAPSLVQACLGRGQLEMNLAGEIFSVTETVVTRPGTLRSIYEDLVPIGVVRPSTPVEICPGRDLPVRPGDRVTVLGPPAELTESLGGHRAVMVSRQAQTSALETVVQAARSVAQGAGQRIGAVVVALVVLVIASTTVLHLGYTTTAGRHLSILDSLYLTVETVSTVGYGDFTFADQAPWMRVFAIVLIILGATAITALFALITDLLLSRRVADAFGLRRVSRMRGHVIVVGLGAVGLRVVEELRRYHKQVVVIESDDQNRHLHMARAMGVPVLIANATRATTLSEANLTAASAVAVLTSDDLTNLETGLSLRQFLKDTGIDLPVTLRIFDRPLGRVIEESFGFGLVRSTSALAAPWFVGAALGLDILSTFYIEQELLLVARLTVAPSGGLAGLAMQDLSARIRVIAIRRVGEDRLEHPPRRSTRFGPGDSAYLIGPYDELISVLQKDGEDSHAPTAPLGGDRTNHSEDSLA